MIRLELKLRDITSGIFVGARMKESSDYLKGLKKIILADENVIHYHRNSFPELPFLSVGSGETSKSMDNVIKIYRQLLDYEIDRSSAIIGIGGGITTDITGFVASTFLRGIPFGFVATTLLGQVDAAIGGKNGVNLDGYKNMIGLIRQPQFVICDLESLSTLDKKELIGGFAEIIKYGAILSPSLFSYLEEKIDDGLEMKLDVLEKLVVESVRCKIKVVSCDENETGERKILNFGHTFAHAFEKLYKVSHGEAVAIGMILAARTSVYLGSLQNDRAERILKLVSRSGLPVNINFDPDEVSDAIRKDKKRAGEEIKFILLEDIGKAIIKSININDIKSILHDLR